jgi:uncharacterized protein (TIGR02001 family)
MQLKATVALGALFMTGAVLAQTKAPEPDYTLSYNIGVVTDYRYRGISQTAREPALQGGADFAHKSGFYIGTWASTIKWIKDSSTPGGAQAKGPVEIDVYGGYKGAITDALSFDVGALEYWYAGNTYRNITGVNANTLELYGALTYSVFTAKYSQSTTNLFGTPNSKGSSYIDLSANFDLGNGLTLTPHYGAQKIRHFTTYQDWSLTLAKDFDGLVLSGAIVGTDWKRHLDFPYTLPGSGGRDLAGPTLVVGLKKNF